MFIDDLDNFSETEFLVQIIYVDDVSQSMPNIMEIVSLGCLWQEV